MSDLLWKTALPVMLGILLGACSYPEAPGCAIGENPVYAPSAGCFSTLDQRLLVVQGLGGSISPPGGRSKNNETAQCTAIRETLEETGLTLQPGRRLATFATGFQLYECLRGANAGQLNKQRSVEVRRAFYLHVNDFADWKWRYPQQEALFRRLIASPGVTIGTTREEWMPQRVQPYSR